MKIAKFDRHTHSTSVLDIDVNSYKRYLTRNELKSLAVDRATRMLVCELETGEIAGYLMYKTLNDKLFIERIATQPQSRRTGIATKLVNEVKALCTLSGLQVICGLINEYNLSAQLFAKENGFTCTDTKSIDSDEFYYFEWGTNEDKAETTK